ncbi:MAG: GNAT family N-acetyltransferase, partial [Candidatus Micrarchaeota archaeon]|nr:GNAT family N-acetyltransferase [Candidatus Micrarchaeota archaeon]
MKFTLKNGEEVEIKEITKAISAKHILEFYAPIVRERPEPFMLSDKPPTLKEEKQWLKKKFKAISKKQEVTLIALSGKKVVGISDGRKQDRRNRDKVLIGIVIAKKFRGQGLGKKLLAEVIKLIKKKLKPKIIYLTVIGANKPARALYYKLG